MNITYKACKKIATFSIKLASVGKLSSFDAVDYR